MCTDYVEEKRDLIRAILTERKMFNLPKITQVIWSLPFLPTHETISEFNFIALKSLCMSTL